MKRFALPRALLGVSTFAMASGIAFTASVTGTAWLGLTGTAAKAVSAVVLSAIAVPLVLLLRSRLARCPAAEMGIRRARTALLGFAVVGLSATAVLGVDAATGGLRVTAVDARTLATFLVVNTMLALLLEAVPEELVFRGYVYTALADRWQPWIAGLGTTALFMVTPAASIALAAGLGRLSGLPTDPVTFAPGGQDPVAYAVLLAVFGAMLVTARIATGSVWVCVAAHLTFLTVNRIFIAPDVSRTGLARDLPAGGELLVPAYLVVATAGFAILGWIARRQSASRRTAADCHHFRTDTTAPGTTRSNV